MSQNIECEIGEAATRALGLTFGSRSQRSAWRHSSLMRTWDCLDWQAVKSIRFHEPCQISYSVTRGLYKSAELLRSKLYND